MVVDTSAIVAILFEEPDRQLYAEAIARAPLHLISAVTRVELACVVEGRKGERGRAILERFLTTAGLEVASVTPSHASLAIAAFRTFGKGRHPAARDIGDCFYAVAAATGRKLLFKGDDFARTDVEPALP